MDQWPDATFDHLEESPALVAEKYNMTAEAVPTQAEAGTRPSLTLTLLLLLAMAGESVHSTPVLLQREVQAQGLTWLAPRPRCSHLWALVPRRGLPLQRRRPAQVAPQGRRYELLAQPCGRPQLVVGRRGGKVVELVLWSFSAGLRALLANRPSRGSTGKGPRDRPTAARRPGGRRDHKVEAAPWAWLECQ